MNRRSRYRGSVGKSASGVTPSQFASFLGQRTGAGREVSNPYAQVVTVFACIRALANAITQLDLRVSTIDDEVIESGPMVELLARPNPEMSQRAFLRALRSWLAVFGEVYIIKRLVAGQLVSLWPVSGMEMHETRIGGKVVSYTYTPMTGAGSETFTPDEVHVIREPDYGSGDLSRPLGPRQAAALSISQHYQADVANDQSLRHGAGGGLGLRTEGNLSETQRKDLDRDLNDRHAGVANRHKWMLLEGAMSVEKLFSTFSEMEFLDLKYYSREDICVSYGINPLALGYGGREGLGSGQHTEAAHQIVWTDTHLPGAAWIAEELCDAVAPHFNQSASLNLRDARKRSATPVEQRRTGYRRARSRAATAGGGGGGNFFIWFDHSGVAVLQRAALDLAKQAGEWIEKGVPLNQLLAAYDLPFEEVPWGNTWYKPFGLVDVQEQEGLPGDDDLSGPPPELPEPPEDENGDTDAGKVRPPSTTKLLEHIERLNEPELARLWQLWRTSWAGIEKTFVSRHSSLINQWRGRTLANLKRLLPSIKSFTQQQQRDLIGEILFDIVVADGELLARVGPLVRVAAMLGGEQSMTEAAAAQGSDTPLVFDIHDPFIEQRVRQREVRITDTTRTTRRRMAESLADGIAKTESSDQLAERIRTEFNQAGTRAKTIARDHVGGAVEDARHEGRRQANVPGKSWIWSRKETGRIWHMEAERVTLATPIPNDALFHMTETDKDTPYPRGPGLGAKDTAGCACTTIPRYPQDSIRDARAIGHLVECGFVTDLMLSKRADAQTGGAA